MPDRVEELNVPDVSLKNPVQELAEMLAEAGAKPRLNRSRVAPSTLHDATYHVAIVACAIRSHAGSGRILAAWLKLLQFVAARPMLVANLREYADSRKGSSFDASSLMPRGYMGDQTHDGVIDFLVAADILKRDGDYLERSSRFDVLTAIAMNIETEGTFAGERRILAELHEVRPSKGLLGGT